MNINKQLILQKISSRKFWALVAGLAGSILLAFNVDENSIAQITAIIGGFGSVAVYMFAEAIVDKARAVNVNEVIEKKE